MLEGGNEERALARYNAGSPTSETGRRYAARVLEIRDRIKEAVR
jgi:soluble lytic murein transglycosylase-like protein